MKVSMVLQWIPTLLTAACVVQAARAQTVWSDDFEDGVIDVTLWQWGGERFGIGGCGAGSWNWSHEEIVGADGYLSMRVWGPASGNTFGGQAWIRTLFDYNDGGNYVINFRWEVDVNASHIDAYAIQITDGTNPVCNMFWYTDGTGEIDGPTWKNLYAQQPQVDMAASDWSIHIDGTNNIATLFDGPDLTGAIIGSKALPTDQPWHIRFIHNDGTSAGFPAGDNLLNLYDFNSQPIGSALCLTEYTEDFTTDPGWITDQPQNYYWDAATATFHATTANAQPGPPPTRYAYTLIDYDGQSLQLEFDLQPADLQWSAGVAFGLFDENLAIFDPSDAAPPDIHYLHAHPSRADSGRTIGLYVRGLGGVGQGVNIGWNLIADGVWYRCLLEYDDATDTATMTVMERDTGAFVDAVQLTGVGGLPADLDYLGFARDPFGDCCPSCPGMSCSTQATAYVDNIQFCEAPGCAQPAAMSWDPRADMLEPRREIACAIVNSQIYAFGDYPSSPINDALDVYDPQSNMWSPLGATNCAGRGEAAAAAVDGIIYVVGGNNCFSNCWMTLAEAYDPLIDTCTAIPPLPGNGRGWLTATGVGGKIYAMGGVNSYIVPTFDYNSIYDPSKGVWTSGPVLPHRRAHHAAASIGDKIYLVGGVYRLNHFEPHNVPEVDVFDTMMGTWSQAAPLPTPRYGLAAVALDGKLYAIGGKEVGPNGEDGDVVSLVEVYDPQSDCWTTATSLPGPQWYGCVLTVDGAIYSIGGSDGAVSIPTNVAATPQGCVTDADCDDGDACTADTCLAGACEHTSIVCDDGDVCTADSCNAAIGCMFDPAGADGTACDDGDSCTQNDVCQGGVCGGTCVPALYADVLADGLVEVGDVLCVLAAANGTPDPACLSADIWPCPPDEDGLIEAGDVIAALAAANGASPCPDPCVCP